MKTKIIARQQYIDRIIPHIDKGTIKVLTGQRRVGKSCILLSLEQYIRKSNPKANFININLEDFAFSHISDAARLHAEITSKLSATQKNYIFIDEIQEVKEFDKVIRSLILDPSCDVYVTGSNSAMLSSEMASRLAGRSVEFHIHPLSYPEFLTFHALDDSDAALDLFLRYGGMPYLRNLPLKETWSEYLSNISDALIYRDIVTRHAIRNTDFLQRLLLFFADNIGRIFTAKKIADYLKSQHITNTVSGVQTYADYICQAFILNRVSRWDIEGKRLFEIGEKYYFEDPGIRNALIGYRPMDTGVLLENAVYNKLKSDGYAITVGVLSKGKEIDFIAEKNGERRYIQVALQVQDRSTAEREFGNLEAVSDNYEKLLVTLRDSSPNTHNGIRMVSLRDFLTA